MTLESAFDAKGFSIGSTLFLVAMFFMWFNGTIGILVTMEVGLAIDDVEVNCSFSGSFGVLACLAIALVRPRLVFEQFASG